MKTEEKANEYLPLRDVVFNTLRESILTGEMKPGERLMEIHLANRLGVSRTPIREAIRMLELEGLVTMIPRRGAEVAQITEKGLRDVLEVRQALDALAIELACERITEEEIRELRRACDTFVQMTRTQDAVRIAQADVALHDIIVRASGNDRLIQMVGNLSQQMYRYRLEYIKDVSQHGRLIEEHAHLQSGTVHSVPDSAEKEGTWFPKCIKPSVLSILSVGRKGGRYAEGMEMGALPALVYQTEIMWTASGTQKRSCCCICRGSVHAALLLGRFLPGTRISCRCLPQGGRECSGGGGL